ncbi:hypothetical protein BC938DRAFT_473225 [Jimgerdemannia flammicorona]|uniref:Phosphoribosyltransferase domain-containing protein n=1 Tax=Jimgerdemannia flammicorona TaxID=994334 RepID=A0A433Q4M5_9FUNG|nr:hypothetical protein BC938DRAFT_473225 [Jimgerdemannia flammicorona]
MDSKIFKFEGYDSVAVTWFGEYHPYRNGQNPRHNEPHTQAILGLKDQHLGMDDYFRRPISNHVRMLVDKYDSADVMIVPSHHPSTPNLKFMNLVKRSIARIPCAYSRVDDFQRFEPAPKLAHPRNAQHRHPRTLIDKCEICGCRNTNTVIVFDDVVASGSSMVGANVLLREHGYEDVFCVALGRCF